MSTFKVEERTISQINPHSNADSLSLAQVNDLTFQFVTRKDCFQVGESVIYFPVDSCFPYPLSDFLGITSMLKGKDNRIKTVTLRGEYSQGYLEKKDKIEEYLGKPINPDTLTEDLGITKFEPPQILVKGANLCQLPPHVYVYDIEGCDGHPSIVNLLMDQKVWITEKMEGMNFGISIDSNGTFFCNTRHHTIYNLPNFEDHSFWKISKQYGFLDMLSELQSKYYPGRNVTLRGEFMGPKVQGNYYELKDHMVRLFELDVDRVPQASPEFIGLMRALGAEDKLVPTLAYDITLRQWLDGKTVKEMSDGKSVLIDKLREGIVIKPLIEQEIRKFGRLFIKQRGPKYLSKTEN